MKKLKWNRKLSILVLIMFITVTFASFNTNLFINGNAYVRVDRDIRITDIHLLETEYNGYENTNSEYTNRTISTDVSLPRQASSLTYEVTITNVSDRRYKITDIIEDSYDNRDVKYELLDASIGNIVEPHTTKTFRVKFTNNTTVVEEDDVYQTLTYTFDYTGGEQEFIVPYDGTYTLEVWGASGGKYSDLYHGGYGGYSKGDIHLNKNQKIFINVGGQGANYGKGSTVHEGGYNGGGSAMSTPTNAVYVGTGGGATHIATMKGVLSKLENYKDNILIVAGGGGGSMYYHKTDSNNYKGAGGSGGGIEGQNGFLSEHSSGYTYYSLATGGTQLQGGSKMSSKSSGAEKNYSEDGSFGQGGGYLDSNKVSGGGGGYYGGASATRAGGAGGSGYIGNNNLSNKEMYCYQCTESTGIATKTTATENFSTDPVPQYAKEGDGYAKITITRKIQDGDEYDFDYIGDQQTFTAPYTGIYKLETWGAQGGGIIVDNYNISGGYGGYSRGSIKLNKNDALNIVVGGAGSSGNKIDLVGGYNGGGSTTASVGNAIDASGGGATHIATVTGLLSALSEQKSKVLIVSGGGGGTHYHGNGISYPGSGGGYIGGSSENIYQKNTEYCAPGTGGTQTTGGNNGQGYTNFGTASTFGQGANYTGTYGAGGGGGWYGGGAGLNGNACAYSGNGGSGYIGNSKLSDKIMYCYNCQESQDITTRTVTTQSHSKRAKQNTAKEGNGYSRITLVKRTINQTKLTLDFTFEEYVNGNEYTFGYTGAPQSFTAPKTGYYQIELWGASGQNDYNAYVSEHPTYGGYTSGKIKLNKGETIYVYVGGESKRFNSSTATLGKISGGATDIRLKSTTNWYDLDSLSSRIMVAGGAGQTYGDSSAIYANDAGGLNSYTVSGAHSVTAATQTQGGSGSRYQSTGQWNYKGGDGVFGIGGTPINQITEEGVINGSGYSSGAGGYYGGGGAPSGGSGNSFISGHNGCVAITAESDTTPRNDSNGNQCSDGTTDITCSKHYSNYVFTDTRMIDGKGYEWTTEVGTEVVGMPTHDGTSTMTGNDGDGFAKISCLEEVVDYNFDFTGDAQEFVAPYNGIYKVELWGASGGGSTISRGNKEYGGPGAYTSGNIELKKNEKLYVYVGEYSSYRNGMCYITNPNATFNCNNNGSCSNGGGATDIRLVKKDTWYNQNSLASRIMVAAGGGAEFYSNFGTAGAGGALRGYDGTGADTDVNPEFTPGLGGTQTGVDFGKPLQATSTGGGGYYAGGSGNGGNAGGGSSYISGYKGCVSVTSENNLTPICTEENDSNDQDIACSYHYSGYKFDNGVMIDGKNEMPSPDGRTTMIGNLGNGYARITLIEKLDTYKISYDLDGGTIEKSRKTYSTFDDDITLETPTKSKYKFLGWTGGKNLINKEILKDENLYTDSKWIGYDNANAYKVTLSPNTTYTLSLKLNGYTPDARWAYRFFYNEDDCVMLQNATAAIGDVITDTYTFTFTTSSTGNVYFASLYGFHDDRLPLWIDTIDIQLELGSSSTAFETYISEPILNVTIPNGSKGNRIYHANWMKQYTFDVNTYIGANHVDASGYAGADRTDLLYDVYINGLKVKSQTFDYYDSKRYEGDTYEITNFTYDTDKYELLIEESSHYIKPISGIITNTSHVYSVQLELVVKPVSQNQILHFDAKNHGNTSGVWEDLSGNGFNGTLLRNAAFENNALLLNGSGDGISMGDQLRDLYKSSFTLELYVNETGVDYRDIFLGNHVSGTGFNIERGSTNSSYSKKGRFYFNGGVPNAVTTTEYFKFNSNHQVFFIFDKENTTFSFGYDGAIIESSTDSLYAEDFDFNNSYFFRDARTDITCFDGKAYAIRLYSSILTTDEINQNYIYNKKIYG